jgi:Tfp pilus assembly protein PilF
MTEARISLGLLVAMLVLRVLFSAPTALADAAEVAHLDSAEGVVEAKRVNAQQFERVEIGASFAEGDFIHTGKASRAGVIFSDGVLLRLGPNTTLQFQSVAGTSQKPLALNEGKAYFLSRSDREFPLIDTPAVSTAIRGTEFVIEAAPAMTAVTVINGEVECRNAKGSASLGSGERAVTKLNEAPVKSILVQPRDAVQWALYYPPLLEAEDAAALPHFTSDENSARADLARGAAALNGGKPEEARRDFDSAEKGLAAQPHSKVLALVEAHRALALLVSNHLEEARQAADKAADIAPELPSVALVNSYVAQARFDLSAARAWLEKALTLAPNKAFLYARLAEIELGFGEVRAAEEHVARALALDGDDVYALTVQGFTKLIENETQDAADSFAKAAQKDSAFPLPRLGLGLAAVREGDLDTGKDEIERAVYLAPNVALYRSYLGKAFFEMDDEGRAAKEYEEAMALDPLDPTPYLYRAYNELALNRPVNALGDVEQSIALNDSRAVYRSRLLLDQDLGVRSAGLAEVFNTLGFGEAARVEAIKSINQDYGNYSAHRLLSDSYQSIALADASLSEEFVAKLLSPLSFNLFERPAGEASLNDYNALFDRSLYRTGVDFTYSTEGDFLSQGVFGAGKTDKFGYLAGISATLTGGSRHNNFSRDYRANTDFQYQPDYDDRFLLDASTAFQRTVDSNLEFNDTNFHDTAVNLGYQHRLGPGSRLVGQASYGNFQRNFTDSSTTRPVFLAQVLNDDVEKDVVQTLLNEFSRDRDNSFRGAAQYLYDSDIVSLVAGSEAYLSRIHRKEASLVLDDDLHLFPGIEEYLRSRAFNSLNAYSGYLYSTVHATKWADLVFGVNYTRLDLEDLDIPPFSGGARNRTKVSPKVGLTLYPTGSTLVRAAYFETLRKTSFDDVIAIEPTLVAGINQRFNDLGGANTRNFGGGIDQRVTNGTYVGVEGLHRHLVESFKDVHSTVTLNYDDMTQSQGTFAGDLIHDPQTQDSVRAYFYQVLCDDVTMSLEHDWYYFKHTAEGDVDYRRITTQRTALGLNYFSPTGLFASAKASWRTQDFRESELGTGSDHFWIFDASVGYRLPHRHGIIALKFTNLFDEDFTYDQSLGLEAPISPDFGAALVGSINF